MNSFLREILILTFLTPTQSLCVRSHFHIFICILYTVHITCVHLFILIANRLKAMITSGLVRSVLSAQFG